MSDAIITVEGVGKRYRLGVQSGERYTALRDVVAEAASRPFRALGAKVVKWKGGGCSSPSNLHTLTPSDPSPPTSAPASQEFWALKDVSFEVKQGQIPSRPIDSRQSRRTVFA